MSRTGNLTFDGKSRGEARISQGGWGLMSTSTLCFTKSDSFSNEQGAWGGQACKIAA